jgi:hypothetical protein
MAAPHDRDVEPGRFGAKIQADLREARLFAGRKMAFEVNRSGRNRLHVRLGGT